MAFFFLISWPYLNRYSLLWASRSHCSWCPWLSDTFFDGQIVLLLRDQSFASSPRAYHSLLRTIQWWSDQFIVKFSFNSFRFSLTWSHQRGILLLKLLPLSWLFSERTDSSSICASHGRHKFDILRKACLELPKRMTASAKWWFFKKKKICTRAKYANSWNHCCK